MKQTNERLMIVKLRMSQWQPRKYDKKATEELAQIHGAASAREIGRFNKLLIDLAPMREMQKAFTQLRIAHYRMTAPWADDGLRVLPSDLYFDYCQMLRDRVSEIDRLVDDFVAVYPSLVTSARTRLNGLFNDNDYPDVSRLRRKFGVEQKFEPLPNPEDTRVWGIGDEAATQIANEIRASVEASVHAAHQAVVERVMERSREFIDKVRKYHETAAAPPQAGARNILYDTAVENLRDVVGLVLSGLNVTGDQELTQMADALRQQLDGINANDLRTSPDARIDKIKAVETTLDRFAGVFGSAR